MIDDERRAKWLATWASMGMEAAYYLRDRGQESDGENLERAVNMILDLAENEIGEYVVRAAIQEILDQWCEGRVALYVLASGAGDERPD